MKEDDDDDIRSVYSAHSATSSWGGTPRGVSTYSGSSSIADAFAMRHGMGLDAVVLQSAIMDGSDSNSVMSFNSSSSRNSRRKKSIKHPSTKKLAPPPTNNGNTGGTNVIDGNITGANSRNGSMLVHPLANVPSKQQALHKLPSPSYPRVPASLLLEEQPQQEFPPDRSSISPGIQLYPPQSSSGHQHERRSFDVSKASDSLELMQGQHSQLKKSQQQESRQRYPPSTSAHKYDLSAKFLKQQQQPRQPQQQQQQPHTQPIGKNRKSSASSTGSIDMSNMSRRMQAAAMLLLDDCDDGVADDSGTNDGIMFDVEIENKSSSSPQSPILHSFQMKAQLKPSMWDRKRNHAIDSKTKNDVNLVLGDRYGEDADGGDDDCFHDEDLSACKSFMERQLNKRKRIRITKRKKSTNTVLRRRRTWMRRGLMASALFMLVLFLVVVVTMVVQHSNGNGESDVQQELNGSMEGGLEEKPTNSTVVEDSPDAEGNSSDNEEDAITESNSTNYTDGGEEKDKEEIGVPSEGIVGNNSDAFDENAIDEDTVPPVAAPTYPPAPLPTTVPVHYPSNCFTSRDQLKKTVDYYMTDRSKYSPVAQQYGWPINEWCVSSVTDFSGMFQNGNLATGLIDFEDPLSIRFAHFDESLSKWDVSNAVDMSNMFRGAKRFTGQGLNQWNVSKVTTMSHMFHGAESFNQDLNDWDVGSVSDFEGMFEGAKQMAGSVSKWKTDSAKNMKRMFRDAYAFDGDLRGWNISNVEHMAEMFARAISFRGGDLRRWDVSKVSNMEGLFFEAQSFVGIISNWNVSSVTRMSQMFEGASSFDSVISEWDVGHVEDMSFMFAFTPKFDSSIARWDTQNVRYMDAMFYNATKFNQPIGSWNVSAVKFADVMFLNARKFNHSLSSWNLTSVEKIGGMFAGASSFHQDLCAWGLNLPGGTERASLLRSDHVEATHTTIFSGTSCSETGDPIFSSDPAGPLCVRCY